MKKKTLITACLMAVGTFILSAATACSSDSSTGASGGAFTCPAVGEKNCPQDTATTQADVDACNKCKAELQALASCSGTTKAKCAADGTSEDLPKDKCPNEQAKVVQCYLGGAGTGGDGGS